jgi:hypothetical protein
LHQTDTLPDSINIANDTATGANPPRFNRLLTRWQLDLPSAVPQSIGVSFRCLWFIVGKSCRAFPTEINEMFRLQPLEKERRTFHIPQELRDAIREAQFLIGESKRDPDVRVDYDDAIQCECLIGGRVGSKKRPFEFQYYPCADRSSKSQWRLALHPLEIEDIADGFMTELSLFCCKSPNCGHMSMNSDDHCGCESCGRSMINSACGLGSKVRDASRSPGIGSQIVNCCLRSNFSASHTETSV